MGDVRFQRSYDRLRQAADRAQAIRQLSDGEVVAALAAASRHRDPLLANVLATEAQNRMRRNRVMARNLAEAVVTVDGEGRIVDANPAAERLLGWSAEQMRGEDAADTVRFQDLEGVPQPPERCPFQRPLITGSVHEGEGRFHRARGDTVPVAYIAAPILQEGDGDLSGAIVSFRDVTRRLDEERRARILRESAEVLAQGLDERETLRGLARLLVPGLADWCSIHLVGRDGRVARVAGERRPGVPSEADHPQDPDGFDAREAVRTGEPVLLRRIGPGAPSPGNDGAREDDATRAGVHSGMVVPLKLHERILGAIVLARSRNPAPYGEDDLHFAGILASRAALAVDNARLQRNLKESHERYRLVAQGAGEGIWDWNILTGETYYSPRWREALGYGDEDVPPTPDAWMQIIHPDDRARALSLTRDFLAGHVQEYRIEHRLRHKDGSYRWMLSRGVLQRDAEGRPARLVGSNTDITDRKRFEEALEESRERYKALFEHSPYGVLTIDLDGTILAANEPGLRMTGRRADEVVGRSFIEFIPEEDQARLLALFQDVLSGEPQAARIHIRHKDGRLLDADAAGVPIVVRGEVVGVHGVWRDVTEEVRWQEALRQSEQRHRLLVESVKDYAIFMLDTEGRVASWNEGAERIMGYRADEIVGRSFRAFFPPEAQAAGRPAEELRLAVAQGRYAEEGWRVRKDGTRFWAHVTCAPLRTSDGRLQGFAKVTRDLTERRGAQERARTRERQQAVVARLGVEALRGMPIQDLFERAVEDLKDVLDVEYTKVLQLDPGGETLTLRAGCGWRDHVAIGRSTVSAGVDSQAGYTLLTIGPVIVRDLRAETRFRGPPLLVEHGVVSGMSVVIHGRARPWGVLGVHTTRSRAFTEDDVNFLQSAANVLANAIQRREGETTLERRVHERTAQLEEALRDLQTFADSVSHDLRAPLRGTAALLEDLRQDHADRLPPEALDLVERIARENRRATRLVQDILGFSRSGREPIRREPVDLSALAAQIAGDTSRNHPEWRTSWRIQPDLRAHADAGLVRILLHNLMHNAAKYSARVPEPLVEVGGRERDGEAWLYVRDNGVGFPMQEARRLFQPFARLSTAAGVEGTGLGLATAHRIATRHGGRIEADSTPGKGTTFWFTLEPRVPPS